MRVASAHHGSSSCAASWMILSSTSVTLRTKVTAQPALEQPAVQDVEGDGAAQVADVRARPARSARRRRRRRRRGGAARTGRTARVAVSYRRRLTRARLPARAAAPSRSSEDPTQSGIFRIGQRRRAGAQRGGRVQLAPPAHEQRGRDRGQALAAAGEPEAVGGRGADS